MIQMFSRHHTVPLVWGLYVIAILYGASLGLETSLVAIVGLAESLLETAIIAFLATRYLGL